MTLHVCDLIRALGRSVVVSCSGYGSPASEAARLAPDGPLRASEWGDEAALLRELRPDLPLIVGRRRVLAAEICAAKFPDAVLLLDDGFQHLPLAKDLTIVLDPPTSNRRCLPAGPYREPWSNRKRADLLIPGDFHVVPARPRFFSPNGDERVPESGDVICALGKPQRFLDTLKESGVALGEVKIMPDHDPLSAGNLLSGFSGTRPILVTGKDWVKLRERSDVEQYEFLIATREIVVEPQEQFREWLQTKLNGIPQKTT
jgi:tetraacyldisaccharide 4'-kinase